MQYFRQYLLNKVALRNIVRKWIMADQSDIPCWVELVREPLLDDLNR